MREEDFVRCSSSGKRCYSEREANIALSSAKKHYHGRNHSRKTSNGKIPRRKYLCNYCNCWHLTSSATSGEQDYTKKRKRFIKTYNFQEIKTIDNMI